jgi:type III pantothenate kinase
MLLAIDIGNSTIGLGLFPDPLKGKKLFINKISTHPDLPATEYRKIINKFIRRHASAFFLGKNRSIEVIISSVVPSLDPKIIKSIKGVCSTKVLIVSYKLKTGLTFDVSRPEEVGADRIANAVGGFHYFKKPTAVIDFGTATTITVVGRKGNLLGGSILPGLKLMQSALHAGTARLPLIPLKKPEYVSGHDTVSSIQSGIIYGTAGAIESLIKSVEKEYRFRLKLILTGGHSKLLSPLIKREHLLIPDLTLEGLRLIYLRNLN